MSQDEFSHTLLYKEYASFNFSNFSKLCSPFPRVLMSVPTLFGLQANVKQGGRVEKRGGVWMFLLESEQSTEIASRARTADL